jgi:hypothetical protein
VAAKKKSAKKKSARKSAMNQNAGKSGKAHDCNMKDVCAYLQQLSDWLQNDLMPQHLKVTNAVCNLDKVAIRGLPNTPAAMLCPGTGGAVEPPVPPPPPKW